MINKIKRAILAGITSPEPEYTKKPEPIVEPTPVEKPEPVVDVRVSEFVVVRVDVINETAQLLEVGDVTVTTSWDESNDGMRAAGSSTHTETGLVPVANATEQYREVIAAEAEKYRTRLAQYEQYEAGLKKYRARLYKNAWGSGDDYLERVERWAHESVANYCHYRHIIVGESGGLEIIEQYAEYPRRMTQDEVDTLIEEIKNNVKI